MELTSAPAIAAAFDSITSPRFVSLLGYASQTGEIADYTLCVGMSYQSAVTADMKALQEAISTNLFQQQPELAQAAQALLDSFARNLNPETQSNQSKAAQATYDKENKAAAYHATTGELYLTGYRVSKRVLVPAPEKLPTGKERGRKPETIAKETVQRTLNLKTASWRKWKVQNVQTVKAQGETFTVSL